MIEDFHKALEDFQRKCSKSVAQYHLKDWYLYIGRQNDFDEKRKIGELEKSHEIDELGKAAYLKLSELIDFLSQKDLL